MQNPGNSSLQNLSVARPAGAADALRVRAEGMLREKTPLSPASLDALSTEAMRQTLYELQVHQIELEMQNDELQTAQVRLDKSRARYFDLYDMAPVGYCTVNEQGLVTEANIAAATLLGTTRSHMVGRRISQFIARTHQDNFYLYRTQVLASGNPEVCELLMVKADGSPLWVMLTTTTALEEDGAWVQRVVLSDISQHKEAEHTLRESEERYRNLFNSIDEGFCVIEKIPDEAGAPVDFRYVEANPAFTAKSGMTGMLGKTMRQMLPEEAGEWIPIYDTVCSSGMPVRFERQLTTYARELELYAFRIGGAGSRKVAVIFNDITDRRLIDAERTRYGHQLLDKNAALELATSAAEKANRAKSDFLSHMSHELRTPLHAILGFAQLIEAGKPAPSEMQKRSVDQILQAGWYLLDLINEILDLAVVESGKLSLDLQVMSLVEVVQECHSMIEPQAAERDICLRFPALEKPYFVKADSTRVKQILVNLLSNAVKYSERGGTVSVTCAEVAPGRVRISVNDSGDGLSPEKIAQLFQPFNRLGREASGDQGTGIGLIMTKRLVELMAGTIGVESQDGNGSTFWIELNLTTELGSREAQAQAQAQAQAPSLKPKQKHTLLYVEDNPANLFLVETLMHSRPDIQLLAAKDGISGMATALATLPDVILMDVRLPDISGGEVLKLLRDTPATAHIPVVALSANAILADIENGLAVGFFRYLTKPIRIVEFMATLDEALAHADRLAASAVGKENAA